jgi:hypothetical protein
MCKAKLSKKDNKALKESLSRGVYSTSAFRAALDRPTDCNLEREASRGVFFCVRGAALWHARAHATRSIAQRPVP